MSRHAGCVAGILAVLALAVLWRLLPGASPPIFDGQCLVSPYAALGGNPPPQSAAATFSPTTPSPFPAAEVITGESPPQAQILMQEGTFTGTRSTITVRVVAAPAPSVKPADGRIDGNVYLFTATSATGAALQPAPQLPVTIILRATRFAPQIYVERFDATRWTHLQTFNAGCGNTYEAVSDRMGEFAVVIPAGAGGGGGSGSGGVPTVAIVAALVVVLVIAVIGLLRLDAGRSRPR